MLGSGYGVKTLTDNWYEDRLAPPEADVQKFIRPDDDVKAGRQIRYKKPASFGTPNDGFGRVVCSRTHEDYPDPRTVPEFTFTGLDHPQFITSETIAEVCYEDRRPLHQTGKGCFATIDKHPKGIYDRAWGTAERDARESAVLHAGLTKEMMVARTARLKETTPAGVSSIKPGRATSTNLVGENPELTDIPTQRSWMNQEDPGLREYSKTGGKGPELPAKDNELSLPLGDGAQAKIMAELKARGGKLYRSSTCITTGGASKNRISIWDDYVDPQQV
ncbi:unnamed protein product [Amoebophrya sp. A120]|nr:unnamed protein product [Amoebophrya sp. A120]|eukprot:GSA120T00018073001.1